MTCFRSAAQECRSASANELSSAQAENSPVLPPFLGPSSTRTPVGSLERRKRRASFSASRLKRPAAGSQPREGDARAMTAAAVQGGKKETAAQACSFIT